MAFFYCSPPPFPPPPPPTPVTGHLLPSTLFVSTGKSTPSPLSSPIYPSESSKTPIDQTYQCLSPIMPVSSPPHPTPAAAGWTRDHDKAFENAIAFKGALDWEAIAAAVPGKTADEVTRHYEILVEDVGAIEAGLVPIPQYAPDGVSGSGGGFGTRGPKSGQVRRKGTPWSEKEHRDFLIGLQMCKKGDWRSISRYYVFSRTPTQVASHAQKYFMRQSCTKKDRRRTSIHDITSASIHDITSAKHPFSPSQRQ